jgi:hypothetical protein
VFGCVRRRLHAREIVADTCSICGACAVLDMHRLLAMRCRYMRIVEEVGRVIEAGTE